MSAPFLATAGSKGVYRVFEVLDHRRIITLPVLYKAARQTNAQINDWNTNYMVLASYEDVSHLSAISCERANREYLVVTQVTNFRHRAVDPSSRSIT